MQAILTEIAYHGQVESKHRRHTRIEAKVAGHVRTSDAAGAAEIDNISLGGLFMRTSAALPVGLQLTIELKTASDSVSITGKIVGTTDDGVGFEFDVLPSETEKRLRTILDDIEKSPKTASWNAVATPNDANVRGLLELLAKAYAEIAELKQRLLKK